MVAMRERAANKQQASSARTTSELESASNFVVVVVAVRRIIASAFYLENGCRRNRLDLSAEPSGAERQSSNCWANFLHLTALVCSSSGRRLGINCCLFRRPIIVLTECVNQKSASQGSSVGGDESAITITTMARKWASHERLMSTLCFSAGVIHKCSLSPKSSTVI